MTTRLPDKYVSKTMPPIARQLLVEVGEIVEADRRHAAIELAEQLLRAMYPELFQKEQQS